MRTLTFMSKTIRQGCYGLGYHTWAGGEDVDYAGLRKDCLGCHDCKPDQYTKRHYKRRTKAATKRGKG